MSYIVGFVKIFGGFMAVKLIIIQYIKYGTFHLLKTEKPLNEPLNEQLFLHYFMK